MYDLHFPLEHDQVIKFTIRNKQIFSAPLGSVSTTMLFECGFVRIQIRNNAVQLVFFTLLSKITVYSP